jgi:hypothetical protein
MSNIIYYLYMDNVLREWRSKINPTIKLTNNVTVNMLFFANDVVLQENEDISQKSMNELRKLSTIYCFKIDIKTKVTALWGECLIRSKITADNKSITEKAFYFSYLDFNISCNCGEDLNKKINKFQSVFGVMELYKM